jgi:hypothetical protein
MFGTIYKISYCIRLIYMVGYTKLTDLRTKRSVTLRGLEMPGTVKLSGSIEEGLMPAEKIVRVEDADGDIQEVWVSASNIIGGRLMASEIGRLPGKVLVELPRESASGRWRIWVKESAVGA